MMVVGRQEMKKAGRWLEACSRDFELRLKACSRRACWQRSPPTEGPCLQIRVAELEESINPEQTLLLIAKNTASHYTQHAQWRAEQCTRRLWQRFTASGSIPKPKLAHLAKAVSLLAALPVLPDGTQPEELKSSMQC